MKKLFFLTFITSCFFSVFGQVRVETADYLSFIHQDSMKRTMQDLENFTTRYAPLGNRRVAKYVQQRLVNYGVTNAVIDSFYLEHDIWFDNYNLFSGYGYNVRGSIIGTQNPDSIVIIGAHLDAINLARDESYHYVLNKELTPGADDNASGIATMIEMARIMHQYHLKPQNRIDLLAFDFEELGLFGSSYDARRRITENDKVILMINNDMVSYQPVGEDYAINIHWYDNAIEEAEYAAELCREYSTITPIVPQGNDNNMRERSDSWEYAQRGIKSIFFIEHTFTPSYHTQYDLCDSSNYDYIQEVGKVNFSLLNHYARFDNDGTKIRPAGNREALSISPNPTTGQLRITNYKLQITGRRC